MAGPRSKKCQLGYHDWEPATGLCKRVGCDAVHHAGQVQLFAGDLDPDAVREARTRQERTGQREIFGPNPPGIFDSPDDRRLYKLDKFNRLATDWRLKKLRSGWALTDFVRPGWKALAVRCPRVPHLYFVIAKSARGDAPAGKPLQVTSFIAETDKPTGHFYAKDLMDAGKRLTEDFGPVEPVKWANPYLESLADRQTCGIAGCDRLAKIQRAPDGRIRQHRLCSMHDQRKRRHGSVVARKCYFCDKKDTSRDAEESIGKGPWFCRTCLERRMATRRGYNPPVIRLQQGDSLESAFGYLADQLGADRRRLLNYLKRTFGARRIIGAGTGAVVFSARPGRVVKITTDQDDAAVAQKILAAGDTYSDILARVYSVAELAPKPNEPPFKASLYVLEVERLHPLPKNLRQDVLNYYLSIMTGELPQTTMPSAVVKKFARLRQVSQISELGASLLRDAHEGNWGLRDPEKPETMVLFDFGYSFVGAVPMGRAYYNPRP